MTVIRRDEPFGILPEEAAPLHARQCERCELSAQRSRVIWGEGREPFLCGTREALLQGMREADLPAAEVYVTYLLKCRPVRAYDKPAARAACSAHLLQQLQEKRPLLLFGFGNVVAEALFPERDDASVKALRGSWLEYRGIPAGLTYHPLAVRRRPNLMKPFVQDLTRLAARWKEITS